MNLLLQDEPSSAAVAPGCGDGKTILVVDDYRSIAEMVASTLRSRGYRVLTALSGEEAKTLTIASESIDLLLTDIEMPQMHGDELAAWFRTAKPVTPILFMSSDRAKLAELRPLAGLEKPFRAGVLLEKIHSLLNRNTPLPANTTTI